MLFFSLIRRSKPVLSLARRRRGLDDDDDDANDDDDDDEDNADLFDAGDRPREKRE